MFSIINHQGNANQNHNVISPQPSQNGSNKKDKRLVLVKIWRKQDSYESPAIMESRMEFPQKLTVELLHHPPISHWVSIQRK
jgi:hypothetical protein